MIALAIFLGLLIGCWHATRLEIKRRAEADDRRQRAYLSSETRVAGHLWLLGAIVSGLLAAVFVREIVNGSDLAVRGLLAIVAIGTMARCLSFAVLAYRRARTARRPH